MPCPSDAGLPSVSGRKQEVQILDSSLSDVELGGADTGAGNAVVD